MKGVKGCPDEFPRFVDAVLEVALEYTIDISFLVHNGARLRLVKPPKGPQISDGMVLAEFVEDVPGQHELAKSRISISGRSLSEKSTFCKVRTSDIVRLIATDHNWGVIEVMVDSNIARILQDMTEQVVEE